MLKSVRDAWVDGLRKTDEPDLVKCTMSDPTSPCALARALIAAKIDVTHPGRYDLFMLKDSPVYLGRDEFAITTGGKDRWGGTYTPIVESGLRAYEAIYRMSDSGVSPKDIADWIEKHVPVTP